MPQAAHRGTERTWGRGGSACGKDLQRGFLYWEELHNNTSITGMREKNTGDGRTHFPPGHQCLGDAASRGCSCSCDSSQCDSSSASRAAVASGQVSGPLTDAGGAGGWPSNDGMEEGPGLPTCASDAEGEGGRVFSALWLGCCCAVERLPPEWGTAGGGQDSRGGSQPIKHAPE